MIVGNDISDNNGQIDWQTYKNNTNFLICKSSEGTTYIDKLFGFNRQQARLLNVLRGYYHFARPDTGNSAQAEAQFFINLLKGEPLQQGELLVLDYEVSYNGDVVAWCKEFLDTVSSAFNGIKPLMYLNQSLIRSYDWSPVVNAGYGLWVADYTYDPNKFDAFIGAWKVAAMQQWTDKQSVPGINTVVDGNVFFGDASAFQKYGFQPTPAPTPPTPPTPTPTPVPPTPPVPTPPVPTPPPTPIPTPPPAPVDPCANYKILQQKTIAILYSTAWWWTKVSLLQKLYPKSA